MPTVDVEQNIMKLREAIEQITQEVFRLQGALRIFIDFKKSGLEVVDLPHEPREEEEEPQLSKIEEIEETSTQE